MNQAQLYEEQTVFLPEYDSVIEIHGADGYGWYADKRDIKRWNAQTRVYRKSEKLKNTVPDEGEPVPFGTRNSRNHMFVFLLKPDGADVTRDWLTLNGAMLAFEDEQK